MGAKRRTRAGKRRGEEEREEKPLHNICLDVTVTKLCAPGTYPKHCHISSVKSPIPQQKPDSPPFTVSRGEGPDSLFLLVFSPY